MKNNEYNNNISILRDAIDKDKFVVFAGADISLLPKYINPTCRNHNINHFKSGSCNLFFIFRVTQYYFSHRVDFYNLML
jgi:hypothetical protein